MDADIFEFIADPERPRGPRRRPLRRSRPAPRLTARERRPSDPALPDLELWSGRTVSGDSRCHVIGLPLGDCEAERWSHSVYCFYHDKLQRGLTEPTAMTYPVWPLPLSGYIFTDEQVEVVA